MEDFIDILKIEFKKNSNKQIATQQKTYMRGQFEFYGIKTPLRREIQKPFLVKAYLSKKNDLERIVKILWSQSEREYHLFSQELVEKYIKQLEKNDISLLEYMVTHNSWWDTVDFIAIKLIGEYFKIYPDQIDKYVNKWIQSKNIWLQRSAILFQLNYKDNLDTILLSNIINSLLDSKEFFINKAIGWVLRNYSRTNPQWVIDFSNKTNLSNLSKKEALRLIKNN